MKFPLGKVTVKDDALVFLALAGQDPAFFLDKHQAGDWGEEDPSRNDAALQKGEMLLSRYRTLWGWS